MPPPYSYLPYDLDLLALAGPLDNLIPYRRNQL